MAEKSVEFENNIAGNFCLCLENFLYFKVKSTLRARRDRWKRCYSSSKFCCKFLVAWKSAIFLAQTRAALVAQDENPSHKCNQSWNLICIQFLASHCTISEPDPGLS